MARFSRQRSGTQAETLACQFLQDKGLKLMQKNFRCRWGEIDLIMQDKDDIVFVEVRSRNGNKYGSALESIGQDKIKKIVKTGIHFLQLKKWLFKVQNRFDVVTIQTESGKIQLDWIKNAFAIETIYE